MFHKNFSVDIVGNKIIAKQNAGTPGVYKIFNVISDVHYKISLIDYDSGNTETSIWIANLYNQLIFINKIANINELYFDSKMTGKIKIGVLFKGTKLNKYFYLSDIKLDEYANKTYNRTKNINNFLLENNYLNDEYYKLKNRVESKPNIILNNNNHGNCNLKISIIIPCHYKHFRHIGKLLDAYEKQTLLQSEIIIILCEYEKLNRNEIMRIEKRKCSYVIKIIKLIEKSPAGRNRYIGAKEAIGDIIIFQDADDLPHIQRNEIINKCFINNPKIVHVLHGFSRYMTNKMYDINNIPSVTLHYNIFFNHKEMSKYNITNGNIAIRKNIVDIINWDTKRYRGQDVALNKNIYAMFKMYLIIKLPLYVYRENLTTRWIK